MHTSLKIAPHTLSSHWHNIVENLKTALLPSREYPDEILIKDRSARHFGRTTPEELARSGHVARKKLRIVETFYGSNRWNIEILCFRSRDPHLDENDPRRSAFTNSPMPHYGLPDGYLAQAIPSREVMNAVAAHTYEIDQARLSLYFRRLDHKTDKNARSAPH